jgi:hypothetical protein
MENKGQNQNTTTNGPPLMKQDVCPELPSPSTPAAPFPYPQGLPPQMYGPPPVPPLPGTSPGVVPPGEDTHTSQHDFMVYNSGFTQGYVRGYYCGMNTAAASRRPPFRQNNYYRGRGRGGGNGGGRGRSNWYNSNNQYNQNFQNQEAQQAQQGQQFQSTPSGQAYSIQNGVHMGAQGKEDQQQGQEGQ